MSLFRLAARSAAVVTVFAAGVTSAHGAASQITCKPQPNGKKSLSPETIGSPGDGGLPEAIVRIVSARLRFSDPLDNGLEITKSTLTPQEAYGAGLPNGYSGGGPLNPSGPWQGLLWPYRDFNDGYATGPLAVPLGNDVGSIVQTGANTYLVSGIAGQMAFSPTSAASYQRGIPGNGGANFARFFAVDIGSRSSIDRTVTMFLENVEVDVLMRSTTTGALFTMRQTALDTSFSFQVPSPAAAPALLGLIALRRRRR